MGLLSFFKKTNHFFTLPEQERIVEAIRRAEKNTSGEIRIYIESKNPLVDTVERAKEIFYNLEMDNTAHRNGVLIYMATTHHELALFGDEGIHQQVGTIFWNAEVKKILSSIDAKDMCYAIENCIETIGKVLQEKFPYEEITDKNELPDDIVFGK